MKQVLLALSVPGHYAAFHALTLACALTGGIVLITAGGLGPWAPMPLAMGWYLISFAVLAQAALGLRRLVAMLANRRFERVYVEVPF